VAGSIAVLLAAADTYVVVLALTDMMAGVGLGIEALQRGTPIISGFLLGYLAVLPLAGRLVDLLDSARVLLGCLAIFVVGSVVTALAVELDVLVVGRFVQGVGGGGLVPATLALVAALWPVERRGTPLGVVGAVQELGAVLGPVLGAVILAVAGWRAIFWFNAAAGAVLFVVVRVLARPERASGPLLFRVGVLVLGAVVAALGVLTLAAPDALATDVTLGVPFVPFSGTSRVLTPIGLATGVGLLLLVAGTARRWLPVLLRADLPGAALVAVALGSLVLTFSSADPSQAVVGPLGTYLLPLGGVAVVALVLRQRTAAAPLVARGVLRGRGVVAVVVSLLVGAALVSVLVDVPLLARLTLTSSQTTAALVLVRFLVAVPVGAVLGGATARRWGGRGVGGAARRGGAVRHVRLGGG
jgi:MFS family permease